MEIENSTIYTIGGSGFIGRHLISRLLKEKCHVVNIDPFPFENKSSNYQQHKFLLGNIFQSWNEIIKPNSIIFYLASASVPGKERDIFSDYQNSVKVFINFMEGIKELSPKIIFLSSAGAIYGENSKPAKEADFLTPKSTYGIHKLLIEKYLFLYHIHNKIEYRIARISNPYGNNAPHQHSIGFVDVALRSCKAKDQIKIYGELSNTRDFIHISDVIDALISITNFNLIPPYRIVNVSYGNSISLQEIIALLESKYGNKLNTSIETSKCHDVKSSLVDNSILKKTYGFSPKYNIIDYINNFS